MIRPLPMLFAGVVALGLATPVLAQGLPTPQQIQARIRQEMDKLPTRTAEGEFMKIEYKELPTDPIEFAKRAAGGQIPPGIDPNMIAKQAMPFVKPIIEEEAASLGTLTVTREVKLKSKKLKPDNTYTFGLLMSGLNPVGIVVSGGDLKKPYKLKFKRGKLDPKVDPMVIEIVPDEKKANTVTIQVQYGAMRGAAGPAKAKASK